MVGRGGGRTTSRELHRVDSVRAEVDTRARLVVIGLIVVALFAGLLTRLWFLQVAGGESLAVAAQANSDEIVQVPALRGRILDVKGRVLAETKAVTALVVDRQKLTDRRARPARAEPGARARHHARGGEHPPRQRQQPAVRSRRRRRTPSPTTRPRYVLEHREDFPDTRITSSFVRVYPRGHARRPRARVHGSDQRRGVRGATRPTATRWTTSIGKSGIEQTFESELRGKPELKKVRVDNRGIKIGESVTAQGRARPRRAAQHRHRRAAGGGGLAGSRAWTVPAA